MPATDPAHPDHPLVTPQPFYEAKGDEVIDVYFTPGSHGTGAHGRYTFVHAVSHKQISLGATILQDLSGMTGQMLVGRLIRELSVPPEHADAPLAAAGRHAQEHRIRG